MLLSTFDIWRLILWVRQESDLGPPSYQDGVIPLNYAPKFAKPEILFMI
ncbi:MAG: hypothetical protein CEN90_517 [Parcubacteria group bacterium Licking1014_17]|nr:MAG: hypothetical protein CEN90_517 [Parcubacteria group bacterium Licking1014_17]